MLELLTASAIFFTPAFAPLSSAPVPTLPPSTTTPAPSRSPIPTPSPSPTSTGDWSDKMLKGIQERIRR